MRAEIITFEKKLIDVYDNRPYIKFRLFEGSKSLSRVLYDNPLNVASDRKDYKEVIFELVEIVDKDPLTRVKTTDRYYVNKEDVNKVMPILNTLVMSSTRILRSQMIGKEEDFSRRYNILENEKNDLEKELNKIKGYWFNRFWAWVFKGR